MAGPDRIDAIANELAQEGAISLGICGQRLEDALAALAAHDASGRRDAPRRSELVDDAAQRAWYYLIQREVMGWHDNEAAMAAFAIPPEVRLRMGTVPRTTHGSPDG